jgi:hypothetical protein
MLLGNATFVEHNPADVVEVKDDVNPLGTRRKQSRKRSRKLNKGRTFVTVDFENIEEPSSKIVWWRLAVVVVPFETGHVSEARLFGCKRDLTRMDGSTASFWSKNEKAWYLNSNDNVNNDVDEEEEKVALFFDDLRARIPNFFFISDSVASDVVALDGILTRRGRPIISQRSNGIYLSTASTWSYSLAIAHALSTRVKDIRHHRIAKSARGGRVPRQIEDIVREGQKYYHGSKDNPELPCDILIELDDGSQQIVHIVRHTPIFDAIASIAKYFTMIDISTEIAARLSE